MPAPLHLIKLAVGVETIEQMLLHIEKRAQALQGHTRHVTRMWPKREQELLEGGSLYWVIKGNTGLRQKIIRLDEVIGEDGIRRCGIILDPNATRTEFMPRKAFQGWRYLKPEDAPRDLKALESGEDHLPPELSKELSSLGVL